MVRLSCLFALLASFAMVLGTSNRSIAQTAYGIDDTGNLFRFDVDNPAAVTDIGNVGFVPRGIDFRPSSHLLYGLQVDVASGQSQLYTIDINNATPTAVGSSFPTSVLGSYNLGGGTGTLGFDFNPTTLQGDGSMRIRVVTNDSHNLRLNSMTGQIAGIDSPLPAIASVDAVAYLNNIASMAGVTKLYDMDSSTDKLYEQTPPNAGTLDQIGAFGVTIDALSDISFDIFTDPLSSDPTIVGDFGFAVLRRPDAPINGILGSYLLYDVNLATGQLLNGAVVGPAANPYSFEGGFAVRPSIVPEPSSLALIVCAGIPSLFRRRRCK